MTLHPFDSDAHDPLAERLRRAAPSAAPAPSPALRGRILAALQATPRVPERVTARHRLQGDLLAAAAVLLALVSAWFLTHDRAEPARRPVTVAEVTHELLGARAQVLALPARAEADLRLEAVRLWNDGSRLAERVRRGLPAVLRARDERL